MFADKLRRHEAERSRETANVRVLSVDRYKQVNRPVKVAQDEQRVSEKNKRLSDHMAWP